MMLFEIPLLPDSADQTLDITLDEVPYTLRILWNVRFEYYSLSISERNGDMIIENIKLVADFLLVQRFQRLKIKGEILVLPRNDKSEPITFESLSRNHGLFYAV